MKRAKRGPLRIGIAGLGFGLEVHLPAFRGIPDVEVVSLLGRDPVRAAAVAAQTGLPVATDLAAWLKAPFDAVSLALPPTEIEAVAMAAIDRGLPILVEKPLGPDVGAAQRLAARATGRSCAVDFELAELESFAALNEAIHADAIGTVRHATVQWLTQSRAYRGGGDGWSWKTDAARGGGALTLFGTDVFYLLEWVMAPVTRLSARLDSRASARLRPSPEAKPADDLANIIVEHRDGAATSIVIGNANPGAAIHRWTIVGDRGTAILANTTGGFHHRLEIVDPDGKAIREVADAEHDGDSRIAPFRRLATRFVEAVRSGGQCRPSFADGLRVAHLVDATRRAAGAGNSVEVATEAA